MKNKSANVKVFYLLTIVNCWRKADILINNNDYIVELNYLELDIEHKEEIQRVKTDYDKMLEKFELKNIKDFLKKNYHLKFLIFII